MNKEKSKNIRKDRRKNRVRAKISGTAERPRLSVFRSNVGMFLQLIDDTTGKTIASAHSKEVKVKKTDSKDGAKVQLGFELGKLIAKKAQEKKITKAVFDRGGQQYHGRIKAVAEGVREGGLEM